MESLQLCDDTNTGWEEKETNLEKTSEFLNNMMCNWSCFMHSWGILCFRNQITPSTKLL